MNKSVLVFLLAVATLFAVPPVSLARTSDVVVSVEIASQIDGVERLKVKLKNTTAKAISVPLVNVPWLTRRSFRLVIAPTEKFPVLLRQAEPLSQDAIGYDLTIPAGKSIEGFVDVREYASGVADARRAGALVVFWLYRPVHELSGSYAVQGGFIEFGKRQSR
jgi:hypothetical protein